MCDICVSMVAVMRMRPCDYTTSWQAQITTGHVVMAVISVAVSPSSITSRMCLHYRQAVSAKGSGSEKAIVLAV